MVSVCDGGATGTRSKAITLHTLMRGQHLMLNHAGERSYIRRNSRSNRAQLEVMMAQADSQTVGFIFVNY